MDQLKEWDLSGKCALITADSRGWTPFFAEALAEAGADIVLVGDDIEQVNKSINVIKSYGRASMIHLIDLTSYEDIQSVVSKTLAEFGKIDILVNNAQTDFSKPFLEVSNDEWKNIMSYNIYSVVMFSKEVGKHMVANNYGRIININSIAGVRGMWNSTLKCASRGAISQLTSSLGLEWAEFGVRVNGIGAGWLNISSSDSGDVLNRYLPSRRLGHPTDLCGLLVYLASEACDFVTGTTINIDGGALAHA